MWIVVVDQKNVVEIFNLNLFSMKTITYILLPVLLVFFGFTSSPKLYPDIEKSIQTYIKDFDQIPQDRKDQLKKIALFVKTKIAAEKKADLVFVCTHNSRRSHMAQIWSKAASEYYGLKGINTFSGGTEASAFNANAIKALLKNGFIITPTSTITNPVYDVKYADSEPAIKAFSKKYSDTPNPKSNFVAVMTCSQADKFCPNIEGASLRVAIPYDDPKTFDGTPEQEAKYDERCKQIATEMLYVFSLVK